MDYYSSAEQWYSAAKYLAAGGFYQQSVSQSCLAVELYLKSRLLVVDPDSELDKSHDTVNIFHVLAKRYPTNRDILTGIRYCRKYFNEARYPYNGTNVYSKELADQFLGYVEEVKNYIDQDCPVSISDLQRRFEGNSSS